MTKFFKSSGLSDNEAGLRARGYSERIDKFSKSMREAKDYEKKEMREASAQQSKYWYNMMETFKENPELANKQYQQKRVETIETIAELNKSDNPLAKKEAQRLQEVYDAQPPFYYDPCAYPLPDLLKETGWIDVKLSMFKPDKVFGKTLSKDSFALVRASKCLMFETTILF